jgi:transcription initiation factor TFIIIB Brf1 subunit/transcription initiation factor TFIIB
MMRREKIAPNGWMYISKRPRLDFSKKEDIKQFFKNLKLSDELADKILKEAERIMKKHSISLLGMTPKTFYSTLTYIMSAMNGERRGKKEIYEAGGTSLMGRDYITIVENLLRSVKCEND